MEQKIKFISNLLNYLKRLVDEDRVYMKGTLKAPENHYTVTLIARPVLKTLAEEINFPLQFNPVGGVSHDVVIKLRDTAEEFLAIFEDGGEEGETVAMPVEGLEKIKNFCESADASSTEVDLHYKLGKILVIVNDLLPDKKS